MFLFTYFIEMPAKWTEVVDNRKEKRRRKDFFIFI